MIPFLPNFKTMVLSVRCTRVVSDPYKGLDRALSRFSNPAVQYRLIVRVLFHNLQICLYSSADCTGVFSEYLNSPVQYRLTVRALFQKDQIHPYRFDSLYGCFFKMSKFTRTVRLIVRVYLQIPQFHPYQRMSNLEKTS